MGWVVSSAIHNPGDPPSNNVQLFPLSTSAMGEGEGTWSSE
jgi:hypothetical protein